MIHASLHLACSKHKRNSGSPAPINFQVEVPEREFPTPALPSPSFCQPLKPARDKRISPPLGNSISGDSFAAQRKPQERISLRVNGLGAKLFRRLSPLSPVHTSNYGRSICNWKFPNAR